MKSKHRWGRFVAVAAVISLCGTGAAMAQLQSGNLYGKVSDQTGAALPGVTVTLDTGEAPQVQVTNAQGEFRFLSLRPGHLQAQGRAAKASRRSSTRTSSSTSAATPTSR